MWFTELLRGRTALTTVAQAAERLATTLQRPATTRIDAFQVVMRSTRIHMAGPSSCCTALDRLTVEVGERARTPAEAPAPPRSPTRCASFVPVSGHARADTTSATGARPVVRRSADRGGAVLDQDAATPICCPTWVAEGAYPPAPMAGRSAPGAPRHPTAPARVERRIEVRRFGRRSDSSSPSYDELLEGLRRRRLREAAGVRVAQHDGGVLVAGHAEGDPPVVARG